MTSSTINVLRPLLRGVRPFSRGLDWSLATNLVTFERDASLTTIPRLSTITSSVRAAPRASFQRELLR